MVNVYFFRKQLHTFRVQGRVCIAHLHTFNFSVARSNTILQNRVTRYGREARERFFYPSFFTTSSCRATTLHTQKCAFCNFPKKIFRDKKFFSILRKMHTRKCAGFFEKHSKSMYDFFTFVKIYTTKLEKYSKSVQVCRCTLSRV